LRFTPPCAGALCCPLSAAEPDTASAAAGAASFAAAFALDGDVFQESAARRQRSFWSILRTNGARFWLFVQACDGEPYCFLGQARYVKHEGSKPMSITWRLSTPMPASLYQAFASLLAA
jgi:hypothetical protein